MQSIRPRVGLWRPFALVVVLPLLAGADGGCSGQVASPTDAGPAECPPSACAGLAAPADAKVCPGGVTVARTVCSRDANGQCGWEFPPCPTDAGTACPALGCYPSCPNGVLKDSSGCDTCQCAPAPDAGATCKKDADCPTGSICGFPIAEGCAATGTCFVAEPLGCNAASPGCACDGSEVNIVCNGLPSNYAPAPLRYKGACTDAGADGGACCPTGWQISACTFPDGGAGASCHNPLLGCASSLTCGASCDSVVSASCLR